MYPFMLAVWGFSDPENKTDDYTVGAVRELISTLAAAAMNACGSILAQGTTTVFDKPVDCRYDDPDDPRVLKWKTRTS